MVRRGTLIALIRDPGWKKIRILDKHPGSATLLSDSPSVPDSGFFGKNGRGGGIRFLPDPHEGFPSSRARREHTTNSSN